MRAVLSTHEHGIDPVISLAAVPAELGDGRDDAHVPAGRPEAPGLAPVRVHGVDEGDSADERARRDPLLVALIPPERLGPVCDWADRQLDWNNPTDQCSATAQWTAVWSCGHLSHFCDEHQRKMNANVGHGETVYCDWLGDELGHDMTLTKWVRL